MAEKMTEMMFSVEGGFDIDNSLIKEEAHDGTIVGYKLPDGRTARLIVALEIDPGDDRDWEYVTSEAEMRELGFKNLDYKHLMFFEE